jgi:hypothetical protein
MDFDVEATKAGESFSIFVIITQIPPPKKKLGYMINPLPILCKRDKECYLSSLDL